MEAELRTLEVAKMEANFKMQELEQKLRKAEDLNAKLENKLYHEDRQFNARIRQLEEVCTGFGWH